MRVRTCFDKPRSEIHTGISKCSLHLIILRWPQLGVTGVTRGKVKPSKTDTAAATALRESCFFPPQFQRECSIFQCQMSFPDINRWPCGSPQGQPGRRRAVKWEECPAAAEPGCRPAASAPVRAHKGQHVLRKTFREKRQNGGDFWAVPSEWSLPHTSCDPSQLCLISSETTPGSRQNKAVPLTFVMMSETSGRGRSHWGVFL